MDTAIKKNRHKQARMFTKRRLDRDAENSKYEDIVFQEHSNTYVFLKGSCIMTGNLFWII